MTPQVPAAVATTFDVFMTSDAPNVYTVLAAALDVPREPIQQAAALELLRRPSVPGHQELLRRLPKLPASVRNLTLARAASLMPAFKHALLQGSSETRRQALAVLRSIGMTGPLSYVLELLQLPALPDYELARDTLCDVVDQCFDRWQHQRSSAELKAHRQQLLDDLDRAAQQFEETIVPEHLVTSLLILGDPSHPGVRRVLWQGTPETREVAQRLLLDSRHPGILRFLMASLQEHYPHPQVFVALQQRSDPEFLAALLRWSAGKFSPQQLQHLHQISQVSWLTPPFDALEVIPPTLQAAVVPFVQATRLPRPRKAGVLEWLLRHGSATAKLAAVEGLALLDHSHAQEVVRENLDAESPEVQAWATSQLRHSALPEAFALLVERLESPHAEVRAAARHELADFNVDRVLQQVDDWSLDEAHRAGQLLLKVDLEATSKLQNELTHSAAQKRIRTARAIRRLGFAAQFATTLMALTRDADPLVRRTAAEALADLATPTAKQALERLVTDENPRVRETAIEALTRSRQLVAIETASGGT